MSTNRFPYQIIFFTEYSEASRNIIDSATYSEEPTTEETEKLMIERNSAFCECYYDKYDNEDYSQKLWEMTID